MNRKEFVKICGILGIGFPLSGTLAACSNNDDTTPNFNGKVIIIGAGAGGLSTGYLLQQQGIEFEIYEASSNYGGRMKIDTNFADFPIPLGAEWLETSTDIFGQIVNDSSVDVDIQTFPDNPDRKFINSSWFNFFQSYILPSVADKITYNTPIQSIDYSQDEVILSTQNGQLSADKVVVSVPLKILQDGDITFEPALPSAKSGAIQELTIWEGFKAFFEFSNDFYGEGLVIDVTPSTDGQKIYYNAALGQNTSKNILGLFVVGKPALELISKSGNDLRDFMLVELDGLFNNQATPSYLNHITQNWNDEPFIKGGYLIDHADWRTVQQLSSSVSNKVYFAGGAYTDGNDWVSVHTAAQSARNAINELIQN
ncbi:flavin monoamine oxidase family protein [Roseivirga sp.]|uniref:flavin monoamine oxidase family protein n=1 Tax=Roseivirga sp. TaxID=1964215 RepID=UPI003B8AEC9F